MNPLDLDQQQQQNDEAEDYMDDLDERILSIVRECRPNNDSNHQSEIRPAKLAATLGISLEDASAQLCGLLKAVGEGSSFVFDENQVMIFYFPLDFERKARRYRRRETCRQVLQRILLITVKCIKILTALGLILSLLVVCIAAMVGLVAAIIAMTRSGQHSHHRSQLIHKLRSLFYTMRQLLWCYAMFGSSNQQQQDSFLQEVAYDLALASSLCCGNPGSIFFWMRAGQLSRRRRRRGWASLNTTTDSDNNAEGVALVRQGTWGRDNDEQRTGEQDEAYRGLLSVCVEFLFGPSPFVPGPSESTKWKLRGAVIVQECSENEARGISLEELSPYIDAPPASLNRTTEIVSEGLTIVSHFNGRPVSSDNNVAPTDSSPSKVRFVFPELLAESATVSKYQDPPDPDDGSWEYLFYSDDASALAPPRTLSGRAPELPSSLQEERYVLTKLEKKQFQQCTILGVLNWIGVVWLKQSLEPGGVLDLTNMGGSYAAAFLQKGLVPILLFYAQLFFILVLGRFMLIVMLNAIRAKRNRRRADFAHALKSSETI